MHSKKRKVRLTYVNHALNVLWGPLSYESVRSLPFSLIKHTLNTKLSTTRLTYIFTIRFIFYMKNIFNAWFDKHVFYHPLKALYYILQPIHSISFSSKVRLTHVLFNVCFKTPALHTWFDVRKIRVNIYIVPIDIRQTAKWHQCHITTILNTRQNENTLSHGTM